MLAQGDDVVPIPGTKRVAYVEENAGAACVELAAQDIARLDGITVRGPRSADPGWINRSTPS